MAAASSSVLLHARPTTLRRRDLLFSAALAGAILSTTMMTNTSARADGGRGGSTDNGFLAGGTPGVGFGGQAGGDGTGSTTTGAGGGGGAAGGGVGGFGGGSSFGGGGIGGTSGAPNGTDGNIDGGGGGGFGGANGINAPSINNSAPLTGANGGNGGNGGTSNFGGGGGGGGAGGYGAVVTGAPASSNNSSITGGNGGNGGNGFFVVGPGSAFGGNGGVGGDGGVGVLFNAPTTFTNTGSVNGGNGGAGGTGASGNATAGAGGVAIVGDGLTVINSGTLTGGLGGDGVTRANAITFTGGDVVLELRSGSNITGNVLNIVSPGSGSQTLRLGGATNASFDTSTIGSQYLNFSNFVKTGISTWTLTGTPHAVTPWTISQGTLFITSDASLGPSSGGSLSGGLTFDGGILKLGASTNLDRVITLGSGGGIINTNGFDSTITQGVTGGGGLTKTGSGSLTLTANFNTYTGNTNILGGFLILGDGVTAGSILGDVTNNAFFEIKTANTSTIGTVTNNGSTTFDDGTSASSIILINNGGGSLISFTGSSTAANAMLTTNGFAKTQFFGTSTGGNAQFVTNGSGIVDFSGSVGPNGDNKLTAGSLAGGGAYFLGANQLTVGGNGSSSEVSGVISDCGTGFDCNAGGATGGSLVKAGAGTLMLSGANTYSGGTTITGGTLALSGAGTLGASSGATTVAGGTLDLGGTTQAQNGGVTLASGAINNGTLSSSGSFNLQAGIISAALAGTGSLTKSTAGTVILTGVSTFTGATFINAGTLEVDGAITNSSAVTVNAGGHLTGSGIVDPPNIITIASGATLAPGSGVAGSSMTIAGNLAFQSGALYVVQVSPTAASFANVTGSASLGGTVSAVFAPGSYLARTYTILHSTGLGGTTFAALTTTNMPISVAANLSYSGTDVFLNLVGGLGLGSGLNLNQQNVASGINGFFNNGGMLPPNFSNLFALSGAPLANALTHISGEVATDASVGTFKLTDQFLRLMLDPFVDGRSGDGWLTGAPSGGAMGFAPERADATPPDIALAYARVVKALPRAVIFDPHWSAWGSGFGGGNFTRGDLAVGSHDVTARDFGFAGGADYHVSPNAVVGFALAGGGTSWGLAQGLGTGRSDAFQAGAYGVTRFGAAYVAAAVAFANHWMSTDRFALAGDHLTASFNGQSYSGRLEAGYRYGLPLIGVTPYAAVQSQTFHTPSYGETGLLAGGFALTYGSRDATDTRSELGVRFDHATMVNAMPLSVRGRLAWAHDWISGIGLSAAFQALPGASFAVSGARPATDSALASIGADLRVTQSWSLAAKFDSEIAARSQTYAGTGTARYTW